MNLYEYTKGQPQPGWPVLHGFGGPPAVLVGEEGRGRELVRLPLLQQDGSLAPAGPSKFCAGTGKPWVVTAIDPTDNGAFNRALYKCPACERETQWLVPSEGAVVPHHNVYPVPPTRTDRVLHASLVRRGGTWGVMPCEPGGNAVALLIRDQSGFRGGWNLIPADGCELPCVIAKGYCAQGDAGRAGGGAETVLVLADGERVWIRRSGRLYGAVEEVRLRNVGGVAQAQTRAEVMEELAPSHPIEEVLS